MRPDPCSAVPHRMIRTLAAVAPLAVLLGAAPAWAAPKVYYHVGAWHAFTDKDDQGAAICGIGSDNSADGRGLTLTYTIGGSDLTITAAKTNWNIPDNSVLEADTQIDRNGPWQAQAAGSGTSMSWVISASEIRNFDTEFRNGSTLTVTFPSGNEQPWALGLRGSTAASATLWRCVQDLTDRAKAAGSPTAAAGGQQSGQAATQPFTPQAAQSNNNGNDNGSAPANGAALPPASSDNGSATSGSASDGSSANGAPPPAPTDGTSTTPPAPTSPPGSTPPPATKP